MTANEIADGLAQMHIEKDVNGLFNKRIQNMLRQQQAEIKRLIGAEPITYGMLTFCKNCGQQNPYFEKAQDK